MGRIVTHQKVLKSTNLEVAFRVGSKTLVDIVEPGFSVEYTERAAVMEVNIGARGKAHIVMSETSLEELKLGAVISIPTVQQKVKILKNGKKTRN